MSDFRDPLPNIVGSWGSLILPLSSVQGKASLPGLCHPVARTGKGPSQRPVHGGGRWLRPWSASRTAGRTDPS